jgi:hypothetical protein
VAERKARRHVFSLTGGGLRAEVVWQNVIAFPPLDEPDEHAIHERVLEHIAEQSEQR